MNLQLAHRALRSPALQNNRLTMILQSLTWRPPHLYHPSVNTENVFFPALLHVYLDQKGVSSIPTKAKDRMNVS